ncbi:MAG: hypothetical protein BWY74_01847 [Firmicutes bacterium ADurb.Bin419]|nr:MAG: hypothetical protein BWY74_01847 [Firmicutes bacterium ADurb.Bin419]
MKVLNFKVTEDEAYTIAQITRRALSEIKGLDGAVVPRSVLMDISATHCNGNPLDLEALLNAPYEDFAHDILGIQSNINRRTGELENLFSPRCSKQ